MPDEITQPQEGTTEGEVAPTPDEQQAPEQPATEPSNDFETLPDWAKEQIRSLRNESATYRTRAKELQASLEAAKSQEDIDAAVREYQEANAKLERELAFARHTADLDEDLRALVTGETEEQIQASAEAVRKAFQARIPKSSDADGGLRPGEDIGSKSPRELARAALASRHR